MNTARHLHDGAISATMSDMRPSSVYGFSTLGILLVVVGLLFVSSSAFGIWAFMGRQDYKNNTDTKIALAVATAKQQEVRAKDAEFAEEEKHPLKTYVGPAAYGSVTVNYPKTWSAYVSDDSSSSPFVDGYFYPGFVPDVQSPNLAFAVRVQVVQDSYNTVLSQEESNVMDGKATVVAYRAPKVSNVIGARIDGQLTQGKSGTMVILPLRNMTLKIWTEAAQFQNDFNTNILPNFSFAP